MSPSPPLIVNCAHDTGPGSFFEPHLGDQLRWRHFASNAPSRFGRRFGRLRAAWRAARCAVTESAALVVSHDPRVTFVTEYFLRRLGYRGPHLAFSFNYPWLPRGFKGAVHRRAFRTVDRFAIFSSREREMYHRHFGIPLEKFDVIHWGVNPPPVDSPDRPLVAGDYICAVGENARDYPTLVAAMGKLPDVRLVLIVRPHNLRGLDLPANVEVLTSVPLGVAMNVLNFARFMALPLAGPEVPCGHVTLVNAMHLGKAFAITRSTGVTDYVRDGENALMCAAGSADEMAAVIRRLWDDAPLRQRLGRAGQAFAAEYCSEARTLAYFRRVLAEYGVLNG